jgi:hypothetical protein
MPITIPTDNAIEREQAAQIDPQLPPDIESDMETIRSEITDLILVPGIRFDGSVESIPWNKPEGEIFDWLTRTDVVLVDDVFLGVNGVFAARGPDGEEARSLVQNFF